MSEQCSSCSDESCSAKRRQSGESAEAYLERAAIQQRMCKISHKILIISGKGGVGKSTVAVNLAMALSMAGKKVGLLDVDIHGPSIPDLIDLREAPPVQVNQGSITPISYGDLKIMSIGLFLKSRDDAVIWRGPLKMGLIKQFLKDVEWGELDYLIIDCPPGTGDEPLSVVQLIENADGAIIVTTPQAVAISNVRKAITFSRQVGLPVIGVVENMSGFICPECGHRSDIMGTGGGQRMAADMNVPFLGSIPIDPLMVSTGDQGKPFVREHPHSETAKAINRAIQPLLMADIPSKEPEPPVSGDHKMRIAMPLAEGRLCAHFGHSQQFMLIDVDAESQEIIGKETLEAPPHEPGLLPRWLADKGVSMIITGGMGARAQSLFAQKDIRVLVGAPSETPEKIVQDYLAGTLSTGENICDH
jgi:ATP-binding protein involved in chromosome partitioning